MAKNLTARTEAAEISWEEGLQSMGMADYLNSQKNRSLGDNDVGKRMFNDLFDDMFNAISREKQKMINSGSRAEWLPLLLEMKTDSMAYLALMGLMNGTDTSTPEIGVLYHEAAVLLGKLTTDNFIAQAGLATLTKLAKNDKKAKFVKEGIVEALKAPKLRTREKAVQAAKKAAGFKLPHSRIVSIGTFLLELMVGQAEKDIKPCTKGWFEINQTRRMNRNKWEVTKGVRLSDRGLTAIPKMAEDIGLTRSLMMPMLVKPLTWERDGTSISGGFFKLDVSFMSAHGNAHTSKDLSAISDFDIDATNLIQNTAWRLNQRVWAVFTEKLNNRHGDAGLTNEDPIEVVKQARLADEAYEDLKKNGTKEQQKAQILKVRKEVDRSKKIIGQHTLQDRILFAGNLLADKPEFFYVHRMDFRGRRYAVGAGLNPQGIDAAKGLLEFAEGKPLGTNGMYWLMVRLANTAGQDKAQWEARIQWVRDHHDDIMAAAADPFTNNWWADTTSSKKVDEPFGLLATIFEYADAINSGNPETFVSHLPIPLDGSNNGVQHLSLIARDAWVAQMTNCTSDPVRRDIYNMIRDAVIKLVDEDINTLKYDVKAAEGSEEEKTNAKLCHAEFFAGKVTRTVVKRGTMTYGYGVTRFGISEQLKNDNDFIDSKAQANYLGSKIWQSFGQELANVDAVKTYLHDLAKALSQAGFAFKWQTPTGTVITQAYYDMEAVQVKTVFGDYKQVVVHHNQENATLGFVAKQSSSAAPNFIHSHDAVHLVKTAMRMGSGASFAMIHDSFGVHACDTAELNTVLRDELFNMYNRDVLADLEAFVRTYAGDTELPVRPEYGTFDVSDVLNAPFVFA